MDRDQVNRDMEAFAALAPGVGLAADVEIFDPRLAVAVRASRVAMKIDLDDLERKVRSAPPGRCYQDAMKLSADEPTCMVATLALIARIRELELEIGAQADSAPTRRSRLELIRLLNKGAVLP